MPSYITFPITVDAEDLLQDAYTYLQGKFVNWKPSDGQLDVATLQAWATEAAQLRELASAVPDTIYRTFGASLLNLPPIDAAPATAQTTWTMIDNAGYTIPAGTLVGIAAAGDQLIPFQVQADVVVLPGATATTAGAVTIVALNDGTSSSNLGAPGGSVQLIDALVFVSSITQVAATSGGVDAEDNPTYFQRLREQLSIMSPRLITPADYAIGAKSLGAWRALAVDGYLASHNLLNADSASFEGGVGLWGSGGFATLTSSTDTASDATHSLKLVDTHAGDYVATIGFASGIACSPGDEITFSVEMKAGATVRNVKIGLYFWDSGGGALGSSPYYSATTADSAAVWTKYTFTGHAPAGTTKVTPVIYIVGAANAEVHYADKALLRRGDTNDWVAGGTAETGNYRTVTTFVVDSAGADLSSPAKALIAAYFAANREINFIAQVADPNQVSIDVTYSVVALPGYDTVALKTAIDAALNAYLDPSVWGQDPAVRDISAVRTWVTSTTVRFQDISAIINNVEGVEHWTTLTMGLTGGSLSGSDITLPGVAPLVDVGTITGTVT